mgnify:CR=1 FL=1
MELLDDKMRVWLESAKFVKSISGIYVLYNRNKEPIFVGETENLEKTFTKLLLVFLLISPLLSFVAKPTAQDPFLGYSTRTTFFFVSLDWENVSVSWTIEEYIVLKIGILFSRPSNIAKNLLPINDSDNHPIKVIIMIEIIISKPIISKGK